MNLETQYIENNMNKFLKSYNIFERMTIERGFSRKDSIALYTIYLNHPNDL